MDEVSSTRMVEIMNERVNERVNQSEVSEFKDGGPGGFGDSLGLGE